MTAASAPLRRLHCEGFTSARKLNFDSDCHVGRLRAHIHK